jgi:MOSC domain-containing protein YiiM
MTDGRLEHIWLKRARRGPMDAVEGATLVHDRGLVGNADQGGRRQVSILAREAWDELMAEVGARLDPSARRANLLVRGVPLQGSRGKVLCVGPCRIRIAGELTPCERMEEAWPGLEAAMRSGWRGGVFGQVIGPGEIRPGDPVVLRAPEPDEREPP